MAAAAQAPPGQARPGHARRRPKPCLPTGACSACTPPQRRRGCLHPAAPRMPASAAPQAHVFVFTRPLPSVAHRLCAGPPALRPARQPAAHRLLGMAACLRVWKSDVRARAAACLPMRVRGTRAGAQSTRDAQALGALLADRPGLALSAGVDFGLRQLARPPPPPPPPAAAAGGRQALAEVAALAAPGGLTATLAQLSSRVRGAGAPGSRLGRGAWSAATFCPCASAARCLSRRGAAPASSDGAGAEELVMARASRAAGHGRASRCRRGSGGRVRVLPPHHADQLRAARRAPAGRARAAGAPAHVRAI